MYSMCTCCSDAKAAWPTVPQHCCGWLSECVQAGATVCMAVGCIKVGACVKGGKYTNLVYLPPLLVYLSLLHACESKWLQQSDGVRLHHVVSMHAQPCATLV
jgi:hypothetical protein